MGARPPARATLWGEAAGSDRARALSCVHHHPLRPGSVSLGSPPLPPLVQEGKKKVQGGRERPPALWMHTAALAGQ